MSNVAVIKFVSGEEIVAEITLNEVHQITIQNPLQLILQPKEDGKGMGTTIIPWAASVDGQIVIAKDRTIFIGLPKQELIDHYGQIFRKVVAPRTPKILIQG